MDKTNSTIKKSLICTNCRIENANSLTHCRACGTLLDRAGLLGAIVSVEMNELREEFGFTPTKIDFATQGIGIGVASELKKRFLPIRHIGTGGMGKLFLVQEQLSKRYVALKVMLENANNNTPLVHQFVREAIITARFQHPHIIPVYDLGFLEEGKLYYTMRYVDGQTLKERFPTVDLEERLRILRSAALAVDYAHSLGLWHRDLKPENILIGQLGDIYVIDWGLVSVQPGKDYKLNLPRILIEESNQYLPDDLLAETNEAVTTSFGSVLGTPAYMSPEQYLREESKIGISSDVWAFGIMLFEALTGQHPIRNHIRLRPNQIMEHVMYDHFPRPSDLWIKTPADLENLCVRMLKKDPMQRMGSLTEFVKEIDQHHKVYGQSDWRFGTFPQISGRTPTMGDLAVTENDAIPLSQQINVLKDQVASLRNDNERQKKKVAILSEISQLGIFEGQRKKNLWRALACL